MKPGDTVYLERCYLENDRLKQQRIDARNGKPVLELFPIKLPKGFAEGGLSKEKFEEMERALAKACVDIVICTVKPDGIPAVLGLRRKPGTPYAGTWYMTGGALFIYLSAAEFLAQKTKKECGLTPILEGIIGVYRNDASDKATSVICPCFVTTVPYETILDTKPADGHDSWRLFTAEELDALENHHPHQTHWYPMHVWRKALATMPK